MRRLRSWLSTVKSGLRLMLMQIRLCVAWCSAALILLAARLRYSITTLPCASALINVARVLRDDLLSRSIVRAKAGRSVSLLRWKVQWTFHASSAARALTARALANLWNIFRSFSGFCTTTMCGEIFYSALCNVTSKMANSV